MSNLHTIPTSIRCYQSNNNNLVDSNAVSLSVILCGVLDGSWVVFAACWYTHWCAAIGMAAIVLAQQRYPNACMHQADVDDAGPRSTTWLQAWHVCTVHHVSFFRKRNLLSFFQAREIRSDTRVVRRYFITLRACCHTVSAEKDTQPCMSPTTKWVVSASLRLTALPDR